MRRCGSERGKPDVRLRICHLSWALNLRFYAAFHFETYFQLVPLCRNVPKSIEGSFSLDELEFIMHVAVFVKNDGAIVRMKDKNLLFKHVQCQKKPKQ